MTGPSRRASSPLPKSATLGRAPAAGEAREAGLIVIGGGPAGLFLAARAAALHPALRDEGILILEKMPRPGRKLLVSGSGRCNVTHEGPIEDFLGRYGGKGRFLKKALYAFTNESLASWLGERGVELVAEAGGKLFPASGKAADIVRVLLDECGRQGISIATGARADSVRLDDGVFAVEAAEAPGGSTSYRGPRLAIAAGGCSYPGTGSSGEGYALARGLGHSIVAPRPALTPVALRDPALCALAGLSFENLGFSLRRGGKRIGRFRGDVLVTHRGLSGPGILDSSRGLESGDILELDFAGLGFEAFRAGFASCVAGSPRSLVRTVLSEPGLPETGLPRRLAELVCALAGLSPETRCSDLKRDARDAIARMATEFPAEIAGLGGFDEAMATAGGISLDEVDPGTMGSRLVPGLCFAGEVLDYDGDTGGFNLQAAFSTADAAARSIASVR